MDKKKIYWKEMEIQTVWLPTLFKIYFCPTEEKKSLEQHEGRIFLIITLIIYMKVNNYRIFIFGWTVPLRKVIL